VSGCPGPPHSLPFQRFRLGPGGESAPGRRGCHPRQPRRSCCAWRRGPALPAPPSTAASPPPASTPRPAARSSQHQRCWAITGLTRAQLHRCRAFASVMKAPTSLKLGLRDAGEGPTSLILGLPDVLTQQAGPGSPQNVDNRVHLAQGGQSAPGRRGLCSRSRQARGEPAGRGQPRPAGRRVRHIARGGLTRPPPSRVPARAPIAGRTAVANRATVIGRAADGRPAGPQS
jgi:hypothetical protein